MNKRRLHTPDEDAALVASWRTGEFASFEALVHRHQKRMLNIAFRITGDFECACEAVQDAFVAAYREIDSIGRARFSTWLTSLTVTQSRLCLEQATAGRKKGAYPPALPRARENGKAVHEWLVAAPSALVKLERAAIADKLQECIRELSVEFREALVLRDVQGYSFDEICAILKTREETLKSRLFRAREQVKDCLKKAVGEL
jgi:RNA polymerase sigma-70 factor (ECF subfamily)